MSGSNQVAPLSVHTEDLTLSIADVAMPIHSTGDRLFVELPTLWSVIQVVRAADVDVGGLDRALTTADLTAELRARGRTVVVVGSGARPGLVSRELGVAPAEFRVGGVLTVLGSSVSAAFGRLVSVLR